MNKRNEWMGLAYYGVVLGIVATLALAHSGFAGTYNFYFNNTEQGDNSTATPNVSIKDGQNQSPNQAPTPGPSAIPTAAPAPQAVQPAVPANPNVQPAIVPEGGQQSSRSSSPVWTASGESPWHFRVTGGASIGDYHNYGITGAFMGTGSQALDDRPYPVFNAGMFYKDQVGINAFGGPESISGVEAEVIPIKLAYDAVQVSLMGGVAEKMGSPLFADQGGENMPMTSQPVRGLRATAGTRLTVYPYPALGIGFTLTMRTMSIPNRGLLGVQAYEAGLVFHI